MTNQTESEYAVVLAELDEEVSFSALSTHAAAAIRALEAKVRELEQEKHARNKHASDVVTSLRAAASSARENEARYLWVRDAYSFQLVGACQTPTEFDAAIDAARSAGGGGMTNVSSTEDLPRLAAILYDRGAGRNIIGHAIDTIIALRAELERAKEELDQRREYMQGERADRAETEALFAARALLAKCHDHFASTNPIAFLADRPKIAQEIRRFLAPSTISTRLQRDARTARTFRR